MDKFSKSEAIHFQKQTYSSTKEFFRMLPFLSFFTQFFRAWKVPTFAAPTSRSCAERILLPIRPSFPCLRPSGTTKMAPKNCYWIGDDKILQMRRNEGTVKKGLQTWILSNNNESGLHQNPPLRHQTLMHQLPKKFKILMKFYNLPHTLQPYYVSSKHLNDQRTSVRNYFDHESIR